MTGDVRDRILGLLSAGPATVARLSAGLGIPGGVVNYELKLLERDGLVRVGTTRLDRGVATPVYVSTAAAAPPPLPIPAPIPGVTWLGDDPYPTPLWTVPHPPDRRAAEPASGTGGFHDGSSPVGAVREEPESEAAEEPRPEEAVGLPPTAYTGISFPTRPHRAPAARPAPAGGGSAAPHEAADPTAATGSAGGDPAVPAARPKPTESAGRLPKPVPQPRRFEPPGPAESPRGPRLHDVRRVPMDTATFYEFAERLDALAREFAGRGTPGAPAAELTILLTRPDGDSGSGYGYGS